MIKKLNALFLLIILALVLSLFSCAKGRKPGTRREMRNSTEGQAQPSREIENEEEVQ